MAETTNVIFKLPSGKTIPLNISSHDTLVEVRAFLSESTELYLHSNYEFVQNNQRLNEYVEFSTLNISPEINVQISHFDSRSGKYHLNKIQELLKNPSKIPIYFSNPNPNPNKIENNNPQITLNQLLQSSPDQICKKTESYQQLVNNLCLSGFNPPPSNRALLNDLFYLSLRTNENSEFQITCNCYGFYVNKSNKRVFDPMQQSDIKQNLLELLQSLSKGFRENWEKYTQELKEPTTSIQWMQNPIQQWDWDESRPNNDLYGIDTSLYGDWNEDLQLCRALPKEDFYQRINRDKTLVKIHQDFLKAAQEGAKAVIDGNIPAANPMDPKETQVFIYNQLFFSYATETSLHFDQECGQDACFSYTAVNCDLRNLNILHKMDIPNLHLQNTALFDYKGYRVMVQSVIPGILNQEQNNSTQYGTIDEGKTIQSQEYFHNLFNQIAQYFYLTIDQEFTDSSGNKHIISGGVEVKGILGSDKRHYLLDSMRLSPRDLNYGEQSGFQCCVVRIEAVQGYVVSELTKAAVKKMVNYRQQKQEQVPLNLENLSEEEKIKQIEIRQQQEKEEKIADFAKFQEFLMQEQQEQKGKIVFNPNLYTNIQNCEAPQSHHEDLKKLANYIKEVSIPNLVKELCADDTGRLADSQSISDLFHNFGVNNRYLGQVISKIDSQNNLNVKLQLEKCILVRCLKHILRDHMRNANKTHLPHTIAHVLNCVFASEKQKIQLNEKKIRFEQEQQQDDQGKKKQKQKNKAKKQENQILTETPCQIWAKIQEIAKCRYQYELTVFPGYHLKFNRLATLRDVCLKTGIVLQMKDYKFENIECKKYQDLPFKFENIIDLKPLVKSIQLFNEDAKYHLEVAEKLFQDDKLQEASDMYQTTLQILLNLYGTSKKEIALCYSKMAQINYKLLKIDQAILCQKLAIKTLKKLYGDDHYSTTHAYLHQGLFYFGAQLYKKAEKYLMKSLYFKFLIGGETYPDIQMVMMNLSMVYQQSGQHQASINCLLESNDIVQKVFGEKNSRSAGIFQAIAMVHFEIEDYKKAVDYQKKACDLFSEIKKDDQRYIESQYYLRNLIRVMEEKSKQQNQIDSSQIKRQFGTNKAKQTANEEPKKIELNDEQNQEIIQEKLQQEIEQQKVYYFNKEREILQEKLRNAKNNLRINRGQKNFKVFQ